MSIELDIAARPSHESVSTTVQKIENSNRKRSLTHTAFLYIISAGTELSMQYPISNIASRLPAIIQMLPSQTYTTIQEATMETRALQIKWSIADLRCPQLAGVQIGYVHIVLICWTAVCGT